MSNPIPRRRAPRSATRLGDLPPPLLARARRRLGQSALVAFGLLLSTQIITYLFYLTTGEGVIRFAPAGDVVSMMLCLAVAVTCRSPFLSDLWALRAGVAGELLVCASLSAVSIHNSYELSGHAPSVGPEALIIAVFPLVVPISPRVATLVSFSAALMPALSILLFTLVPTGIQIAHPLAEALSVSTYGFIAALIAYAASRERHEAYVDTEELRQEQALLETLLGQVGASVILVDNGGRVVYANATAGQALLSPGAAPGMTLDEALDEQAKPVGRAFTEGNDATVTLMIQGEAEVLKVARREIEVGFLPHKLLIARRFTEEIRSREIAAYKRIIRVLVHELTNSLGPIASVLSSAQKVLGNPQHAARLQSVFTVVRERVQNLTDFLERYARLARLPTPRPKRLEWRAFLAELDEMQPFRLVGEPPSDEVSADAGQLQQVMLNLIRNAEEAGGKVGESEVSVARAGDEFCVHVSDRGEGLSEEAWRNAMTPLFSTKPEGSGLGLALCREIVEAHGGRIGIFPRPGGGTTVRFWLPGQPAPQAAMTNV